MFFLNITNTKAEPVIKEEEKEIKEDSYDASVSVCVFYVLIIYTQFRMYVFSMV